MDPDLFRDLTMARGRRQQVRQIRVPEEATAHAIRIVGQTREAA
jgi:hypothetical protein